MKALSRRSNTIEALRGIAALLVVMYHLQDVFLAKAGILPFGGLFGSGNRGVDLFFVLSGFIIMTTHACDVGSSGRLLSYLYKRCCRVFPAVWIMTLLAATLYACHFGSAGKMHKLEPWGVVASALLLPQAGPALVNVTWTLKYEMFFYGAFALLIVSRRIGLAFLLAWQGAAVLTAIGVLHPANPLAGYYVRPICLEFGIGMICAWLMTRKAAARKATRHPGALLAAGTGGFLAGLLYEALCCPGGLEAVRVVVFGGSAGAIILGLIQLEQAGRIRAPACLTALGRVSYAVYLVHYSVITLAAAAVLRAGWIPLNDLVLLGCGLLGVVAGAAFHYLVDQPIQLRLGRFGRHLFEAHRSSASASSMGLLTTPQAESARW